MRGRICCLICRSLLRMRLSCTKDAECPSGQRCGFTSGCKSKGKCIVPTKTGHCIDPGGRCGCDGRPVDIFCEVGSRTEYASAPTNAVGPCPKTCSEQSECGSGLVCWKGFCVKPYNNASSQWSDTSVVSDSIDNWFRFVSWVLFSCRFQWWIGRTEQAPRDRVINVSLGRHRMRRGRHSRSIPQAPSCGLCFLGKWLMSYDLKRNLGLRPS
jgi:hypothetical protein